MEMHQKGHFPIEKLCRTYPVEKLEEAIHDMHTGKVCPLYSIFSISSIPHR